MSAVARALWRRRLPLSTLIGLPFLALVLGCWPVSSGPAAVDGPRPVSIGWTAADAAASEFTGTEFTGAHLTGTGFAGIAITGVDAAVAGTAGAAQVDRAAPAVRPVTADPATVHTGPLPADATVAVGSGHRSLRIGRAPPRR
jgi:hypothetical protein